MTTSWRLLQVTLVLSQAFRKSSSSFEPVPLTFHAVKWLQVQSRDLRRLVCWLRWPGSALQGSAEQHFPLLDGAPLLDVEHDELQASPRWRKKIRLKPVEDSCLSSWCATLINKIPLIEHPSKTLHIGVPSLKKGQVYFSFKCVYTRTCVYPF